MSASRIDPEGERLVLGHSIDWESAGPAVKFEGLAPATARALLDDGYLDPDRCCGRSPSMAAIVSFMERHDDAVPEGDGGMSAHGRVIGPTHPDAGVVLEGINYSGPTSEAFVREFATLFAAADSFMLEKDLHGRCWFA